MYACTLCSKPFKQLSSRNRHLEYCRQTTDRPRARTLSCRACSAAKTKCTSTHPSCTRCLRRGIECVYEQRPGRRQLPKQNGADETPLMETRTPTSVSTNLDDGNTVSLMANLDQLADNMIWDGQSNSTDFLLMDSSLAVPRTTQASAPIVANTPDFTFGLQSWGMDPPELLTALSAPPKVSPLADAGFLTRLPIDDPIAQRHATHLIQILRAFPQMMIRRAVFPPFIHPNWHRGDEPEVRKTLPEPIGNCMSIAQMFASRTPDTRAFVWNAIRTEQRRLMDQSESFGPDDLLASIQCYIIYIIMRVVDDAAYHSERDLNMLLTFAVGFLFYSYK
ncbi:hypothetical protein N7520_004956 [Penicillium odoratum]|uniref:uncharacterized protein n=1 Tax=Penicillium odoratum TaxID=1167516 RepID=UPI0025474371|nr:uncharacterized protein N7520_004956 [Penicillium odoratum]KAJ5765397.1 hypothetical protein N7520_004956 [Penicillium odoratum]